MATDDKMQVMTKHDKPAVRRPPAPQEGYRKPMPDVVDPRWLLKAGGLMVAVCLLCAYVAICVLFYTTQWQLVLHPSRVATHTVAEYGLKAEDVEFGAGLRGSWIAGDQASEPMVLMLSSGDGSASDSLRRAKTFHDAHLNVLLFDYRGYGKSAERHPTQAMMEADATEALEYVRQVKFVPLSSVVVYGAGVGASLALKLCGEQNVAALVLERASGDLAKGASEDPRSRIVPFHWLFHESFPLAARLKSLKTPKLLVAYPGGMNMRLADDPKMIVDLPAASDEKDFREALQRFLDSYVARPASVVKPAGG